MPKTVIFALDLIKKVFISVEIELILFLSLDLVTSTVLRSLLVSLFHYYMNHNYSLCDEITEL